MFPRLLAALALFASAASFAQFVKEIDTKGRVTYRQDPAYDYSEDQPDEENRRINEEQLRKLREFIEYRAGRPTATRRKPHAIVRSGASVCSKRISLLKPKTHGCD
jgi:hypothetical protein